jgi:hypothetical protein
MKTAICFIHDRMNWYLNYAVNQAISSNPDGEVVVIGSASLRIEGCTTVDIGKYEGAESSREFLRVYKHMSPLSYEFESFCFLRWFYLLEYMREYEIDFALYLDSDSLMFSSLEEVLEWAGKEKGCGFMIPEQEYEANYWVGSGNSAYWTKEMLQKFCDFILRSYQEETGLETYRKKWKSDAGGGICDMTALYLFWRQYGLEIRNLAVAQDGMVFDLNINSAANYRDNEFRKRWGRKRLYNLAGRPAFMLQSGKGKIGVLVAHFQGMAKPFMPKYYRGRHFKGKVGSDIKSFFARSLELVLRGTEKLTNKAGDVLRRYLSS